MLAQFSITNFLSFREKATFSMVKSKTAKGLPSHVFPINETMSLLRGAAFYGANGSGKSNFVKALLFAQQLLVEGVEPKKPLDVRPFKLDKALHKSPSEFEFILLIDGDFYTYGFHVDRQRVIREWLYRDAQGRDSLCFERTTNAEGVAEVRFAQEGAQRSEEEAQFLRFVARGTRENQLFLNATIQNNLTDFAPIDRWFRESLVIISSDRRYAHNEVRPVQDADYTSTLALFLSKVGLGIHDADSKRIPLEEVNFLSKEVLERLLATTPAQDGEYIALENGSAFVAEVQEGVTDAYCLLLRLYHSDSEGKSVEFFVEEESDGTRRLIELHPLLTLLHSANACSVVVVDELDRHLHAHVTRHFLQLALAGSDNPLPTQLLFTAHDATLIAPDVLRADEIWFVEKDTAGATQLASLVEFKYPTGLELTKGYLSGRFGAIPFLGDPQILSTPF